MIITGYISEFDGQNLTIIAPLENPYLLQKQQITECEIRLTDGRHISEEQRKKIYKTMADISLYTGNTPDEVKAILKCFFIAETGANYFSLSDCSMTVANEFLTFLIEFCIEHDIPTEGSLIERSPDISRYIYWCLLNKKCCICQKKAELHHAEERIGMGRNRKEIIHFGMRVEPLCRQHHTECHNSGQETFNIKYHVFGIKADNSICEEWKIKKGV